EVQQASTVAATEEFDILGGTQRELARKKGAIAALQDEGSTLGPLSGKLVDDLIGPAKDPIGTKLLRQMGWREGQGVGPRAKRKRGATDDDIHAAEHLFAPENVEIVRTAVKTDTHGLGYNPFRQAPEFSARKETAPSAKEGADRKPVGRGGFGVGVFEDDDDDMEMYGSSMTSYDVVIDDDEDDRFMRGRGVKTAKESFPLKASRPGVSIPIGDADMLLLTLPPLGSLYGSDGKLPIPGFVYVKETPLQHTWPAPPPVPADFTPFHVFPGDESSRLSEPAQGELMHPSRQALLGNGPRPPLPPHQQQQRLTADMRRDILGEEPIKAPARSVFSYLPVQAQGRLQEFIDKANRAREEAASGGVRSARPRAAEAPRPPEDGIPEVTKDMAIAALKGFMPFGNDLGKQGRYRRFLEVKAGISTEYLKAPPEFASPSLAQTVTERDANHEFLEFAKASTIYRPLSSMMASRFTSSSEQAPEKGGLQTHADLVPPTTGPKIVYGPLTRTIIEFLPVPLLCKRFGVRDPHEAAKKKKNKDDTFAPTPAAAAALREREKEVLNPRAMDELMRERDRLYVSAPGAVEVVAEDEPEPVVDDGKAETFDRPPMDIFKAIFADDDDGESSDDEDEEEDGAGVKPAPQVPTPSAAPRPVSEPVEDQKALPPPTFRPLFRRKEDRVIGRLPLTKSSTVAEGAVTVPSATAATPVPSAAPVSSATPAPVLDAPPTVSHRPAPAPAPRIATATLAPRPPSPASDVSSSSSESDDSGPKRKRHPSPTTVAKRARKEERRAKKREKKARKKEKKGEKKARKEARRREQEVVVAASSTLKRRRSDPDEDGGEQGDVRRRRRSDAAVAVPPPVVKPRVSFDHPAVVAAPRVAAVVAPPSVVKPQVSVGTPPVAPPPEAGSTPASPLPQPRRKFGRPTAADLM
ncbi:hypothetical protein BDK51DRAFT_50707, partial [Blyttiomyces helicus]